MPPRRRAEPLRPSAYDPLSERNLGRAIREELERQPVHPLPPPRFMGAGLYALYYVGPLPVYEGINSETCDVPIYVGKAEAGTSSYGLLIEGSETFNLYNRIRAHYNSVRQASANLSPDHFLVRYLVTGDIHIVLGEAGLLNAYAPVLWNTVLTGFGINAPGSGRRDQRRSRWDTIHPGRKRAERRPPNELTVEALTDLVRTAIDARLSGEAVPEEVLAPTAEQEVGLSSGEQEDNDA